MKYLLVFSVLICCSRVPKYQHEIGFISSDESVSPALFKVCDSLKVFQYYNSFPNGGYKFSKRKLRKAIEKIVVDATPADGYTVSRFVISCQGRAGRLTVSQYDLNLREVKPDNQFARQITDILLSDTLTWQPVKIQGTPMDTYMYVMVKINDGKLQDILP